MKRALCLLALGFLLSLGSRAASIADQNITAGFYTHQHEGWYWYQDPEKESAPHEEPQPAPLPTRTEPRPITPSPFSAAWVRDMLPKYRDTMWSNPTPENVQAYFLLQRFAIDRSQEVARVSQEVIIGNQLLDENFRRPTSSFGLPHIDREANQQLSLLLQKIQKKAGLFFFFKSDCRFCELQAPLIAQLANEGFEVLAISIDGGKLESADFPNTHQDAGHASQLNVTATPALFLVSGDGVFEALGQGLLSLPECRKRIALAAHRQGWITDEDINLIEPVINPNSTPNLSEKVPLLLASFENPTTLFGTDAQIKNISHLEDKQKQSLPMDATGFIEPKDLIALFDNSLATSGQLNLDDTEENENE